MSIKVTKNSITAKGKDANKLLIAFSPDVQLLEWRKNKTGSEEFQNLVLEAITNRKIKE